MNEHRAIIPDLDDATRETVERLASARGMTSEALAGEAIERFVTDENELDRKLEEGATDFARGDYVTHKELAANLRRWREHRIRPR